MIADPYKVLGVDPGCTDTELKKAYREKSKKWHPDQNPDNTEYAEARFKEVQEAYRQILDARERGTSGYGQPQGQSYQQSSGPGYQSYANYGSAGAFNEYFNQWQQYSEQQRAQESAETNEERAARNYINNGYFREAFNALNGVPEINRRARWYYYAAIASRGVGNNVTALDYAKRAADMEPDNQMYAMLLNQMSNSGTWYQNQNRYYGFGGINNVSQQQWCYYLCLANMLCNCCMGGRGGFFFF